MAGVELTFEEWAHSPHSDGAEAGKLAVGDLQEEEGHSTEG